MMWLGRTGCVLAALASALAVTPARAQLRELVDRTALRVCADPGNLPFSNDQREGFENKIADVIGRALSLPVEYVWFPQVVGFVRNTLAAGRCDLVMGTVAGDEVMQTTNPYYYTSYVLIFRRDRGLSAKGLDDPALKPLHVGVVAGTPPSDLMVRYGLMVNARPYALTVDTRFEHPTHRLVEDVAAGAIDAGAIWGPIAGYYVHHDELPLAIVPLKSEPGAARMDFHIAMGVRANEPEWRGRINRVISERQAEITAILRDYGVPLLNEQGQPLPP